MFRPSRVLPGLSLFPSVNPSGYEGSQPTGLTSAFANRDLHLVLANFEHSSVEIETSESFTPMEEPAAIPRRLWRLEGRSLSVRRVV